MSKQLEFKNFEIKALNYDEGKDELIVDGYAAIFNTEDSLNPSRHPELKTVVLARDIIHTGAFTKTLNERMQRIKVCKNHNLDDPIGIPLEIKEDEIGLFTSSRISEAEPKLKTKIREGIFNEMSIGYVVTKCTFEQKTDGSFIRHIYEVKLYEWSIVTIGRHEDARITELKSLDLAATQLDKIIEEEKNETKKFKLLQLKSLITTEPSNHSEDDKPTNKEVIDFDKLTYTN